MRAFAALLERLAFTPRRTDKLRLVADYLAATPDPDRGYALAALTGDLDIPNLKPAMLRALVAERVDPELFALSYDYVGDLAETIALIWPAPTAVSTSDLPLGSIVEALKAAPRGKAAGLVADRLDMLPATDRYALLKLVTGGLRVGVSGRLARQALASLGGVEAAEIEELWHGLEPPYAPLFDWLTGGAEKPIQAAACPFRPVMLAHPLDAETLPGLDPADFVAEWKWDGIRVQASASGGVRRLYSRSGDDISKAFPDLLDALDFDGTLDGELLATRPGGIAEGVAPFATLQTRLNRKTVSAKMIAGAPAFLRAYDLLVDGATDLRERPFAERRVRLRDLVATLDPARFDLSAELPFDSFDDLARLRAAPPDPVIEGLMLKRRDSPYRAGRVKGLWFKWKRDPHVIDAVLLYAQRGHGKRSGLYSDYTFGVWDGDALVPVGKAYFGFTDAELAQIDRFVRTNTVERFGPVRSVRAEPQTGLVLEIAFEGLNRSTRHKSGVAMRFPRVARLRWDKPPAEADRIETLRKLLPPD